MSERPRRFAYADPPYLGCGASHYGADHPDAAEWDVPETHRRLVSRLLFRYPDGWALSLNPRDLAMYLQWLPDDVRIAAWCKTWHQIRPTTVQFAWEPVIFFGGRKDPKRAPMVRDWLTCNVTTGQGVKGAKPAEFNRWVLDLLCYRDGDVIDDLFPGSGSMATTLASPPFEFPNDDPDPDPAATCLVAPALDLSTQETS